MGRYTEKQKGYMEKYLKDKGVIKMTVPKEDIERYKEAAKTTGKSLTRFMLDLADAELYKMHI